MIKDPARRMLEVIVGFIDRFTMERGKYSPSSNLVRDAVEASPPWGTVTISFSHGEKGAISIHNPGAIPPAVRDRFFETFAAAEKLGAAIEHQTSEEAGATITASLPLR